MSLPTYPKYKSSGMKWLGSVPEHWRVRSLKHILSTPITDGPHETPVFSDVGIPFVSAEAVAGGVIDFSKIRAHISFEDHRRYSAKYAPKRHDIYMVKSGATTGVTAIVDTDVEFNIWSPLAAIRCDHEIAHPLYILNFLRSRNFQEAVTLNWSFGTQQNIGMGVLGNLSVVLPPLEEQFAIATFLHFETAKIDTLIAEQEKLITLLAEKRLATISRAVTKGLNPNAPMKESHVDWLGRVPSGWTVCKLSLRYSIELGKMLDERRISGKHLLPYLRNQDVQWGAINVNELPKMDVRPGEIERYTVRAGDLLVCEGGDVGRAAIWKGANGEIGFQKALHRLRPLDSAIDTTSFFYFSLIAAKTIGIFNDSGNKATIAHLPAEKFRQYRFAFPPFKEQQHIVNFLNEEIHLLDSLASEAIRGIGLLKERRSALISAAVTGKIDVRQITPLEQSMIQKAA